MLRSRKTRMNGDLRLDAMMKSIDVYGRLAFGGQCVAAMAMLSAPAIFVTASVMPFIRWDDDRGEALLLWLGGWAAALTIGAVGVAFAVFCWRWSGDWITEWPGYAVAVAIAVAALATTAFMLVSTDVPSYVAFLLTVGAAFVSGCLVAGHLAGTHVVDRPPRPRALVRRR